MTLGKALMDLYPGDIFYYKDKQYMLLKTTPADLGGSEATANCLIAVSLDTFDLYCFEKDWEVTLV